MLARDALKTSVLRMLLSSINYYEIQKGTELWKRASLPASEAASDAAQADRRGNARYTATDEDVLSVIQREVKQRKDSIEEFKKANRPELVEKESKELKMLQAYLPQQMSKEEIKKLAIEVVKETNANDITDIGKVMGALMPKIKGKADGAMVSKMVREELS